MNEVAEMFEIYRIVARCPECESDLWEIVVDQPGDFKEILGLVCGGCELKIDFKLKVTKNDSDAKGERTAV